MRTPKEIWNQYREFAFEENADDGHVNDCEACFYAGIESAFRYFGEAGKEFEGEELVEHLVLWRKMNRVTALANKPTALS
jgi:hypothetical protein